MPLYAVQWRDANGVDRLRVFDDLEGSRSLVAELNNCGFLACRWRLN